MDTKEIDVTIRLKFTPSEEGDSLALTALTPEHVAAGVAYSLELARQDGQILPSSIAPMLCCDWLAITNTKQHRV